MTQSARPRPIGLLKIALIHSLLPPYTVVEMSFPETSQVLETFQVLYGSIARKFDKYFCRRPASHRLFFVYDAFPLSNPKAKGQFKICLLMSLKTYCCC